jgi:hypothetical protein
MHMTADPMNKMMEVAVFELSILDRLDRYEFLIVGERIHFPPHSADYTAIIHNTL